LGDEGVDQLGGSGVLVHEGAVDLLADGSQSSLELLAEVVHGSGGVGDSSGDGGIELSSVVADKALDGGDRVSELRGSLRGQAAYGVASVGGSVLEETLQVAEERLNLAGGGGGIGRNVLLGLLDEWLQSGQVSLQVRDCSLNLRGQVWQGRQNVGNVGCSDVGANRDGSC